MGGTIGVYSAGPMQGSEFWFTLPITARKPVSEAQDPSVEHAAEAANQSARVAYEPSTDFILATREPEVRCKLLCSAVTAQVPAFISVTAQHEFEGQRVLLIEPDRDVLHVLELYLTRRGGPCHGT